MAKTVRAVNVADTGMNPADAIPALPTFRLAVRAEYEELLERAATLAAELACPFAAPNDADTATHFLDLTPEGLALSEGRRCGARLRLDWTSQRVIRRLRAASRRTEPLLAAVGAARSAVIVDATAGLCGDALILAAAGYRVLAFERSPVVVALVLDAMERALSTASEPLVAACRRVELRCADSGHVLPELARAARPEVVYLDPMFPPRERVAVRKELALLRTIVGESQNESGLLDAARRAALTRVVVKRHPTAPPISPGYSGQRRLKMVRFDLYAPFTEVDQTSNSSPSAP